MSNNILEAICTAPLAAHGISTGETVTYLNTTGGSGGNASAASAGALNITGDLEIVVRVALTNWTGVGNQVLVAKRNTNQEQYMLRANSTGNLAFSYSSSGTSSTVVLSTATLIANNGQAMWLKVTFDADNGASGTTVRFYYAADSDIEPTSFTQLGSDVVTATAVTLSTSPTRLEIGSRAGGVTERATGKFFRAIVRNGIAGTTVFDADFTLQTAGATTFDERTIKTVTVSSPATIVTADSGWRFALEMIIASGGGRVGKSKVGTSRVSGYEWWDVTPDFIGVEWTRGTSPTGQGFPRANVGVLNLQLQNGDNFYSPWNQSIGTVTDGANVITATMFREWFPGAVIRAVFFKTTSATSYSTNGTGVTSITRTDWQPVFTGLVEAWEESILYGRNIVQVTAVETMSLLAAITKPAQSAVGAGDTLSQRIVRLMTDAGWQFGVTDAGYYGSGTNYNDLAGYTLQATTMAANRLAEAVLSGESILNTQILSDVDGSLRIGVPTGVSYTNIANGSGKGLAGRIVHVKTSSTAVLATDVARFPNAVVAYYAPPLVISQNMDPVINSVSATRVGGAAQTATTVESVGQFGLRSYNRTDLICTSDALAGYYASGLLTFDYYSTTFTEMDQTLQPGSVTFVGQQTAQRNMELHAPILLDYGVAAGTTDIRFVGRIALMKHTVQPIGSGIQWSTNLQMLALADYKPT